MNKNNHWENTKFRFNQPAFYEIKVQGEFSNDWLELLRGMKLIEKKGEGKSTITLLKGEIRDQSALAGIMDVIYQFHLSVVHVQNIKNLNND